MRIKKIKMENNKKYQKKPTRSLVGNKDENEIELEKYLQDY
jgi:hypothetical protein